MRELALAQAVTQANGQVVASRRHLAGPGAGIWLRALCPGASGRTGDGLRTVAPVREARLSRRASSGAHDSSSDASADVSPRSGAVCTSRVGAGRARAQAWQASLRASSIQASGRGRRRRRSRRASSARWRRPARPRSAGTEAPRAGRAGAAGAPRPSPPSRWPTPDRSPRPRPSRWAAAERERKCGYAVDRVEGAVAARCSRALRSGGPNSERTPSMSTINSGFGRGELAVGGGDL